MIDPWLAIAEQLVAHHGFTVARGQGTDMPDHMLPGQIISIAAIAELNRF